MNKEQIIRGLTENSLIRICAFPILVVKHSNAQRRYKKSLYGKDVKRLQEAYKGKRCFIIGNGPSLKLSDLDMLNSNNELCFGMNHIYDLFDKTDWRPNFYFCFDRDFIRSEYETIINIPADYIFIEYSKAPRNKLIHNEKIVYFFADYVFGIKRGKVVTDHVCTELSKKSSFVTNTTHLCIEFAMYMGFKEIYLLGMDHDYSFGYGKNHAEGIKEGKHNDLKHDHNCDLDVSAQKFNQYKCYADAHGIKIYNVSAGGKLDVFERKELSEALGMM